MEELVRHGCEISTDPARIDRELVYRFLSEEAVWAQGIPKEVVDRAIENSLCFGIHRGEEQVGFARIVTDRATFAYVDDVFVVGTHRRKGLAVQLVEAILSHRELEGIKSWWALAGSEAERRLFERAGFLTPGSERLQRWMTQPGGGRGFYPKGRREGR